MLISAVFDTANIEMNGRMSSIGSPGAPALTTSTSGVSLSSNTPTGTSATATMATMTYTMPAIVRPLSSTLGKVLTGSFVSSAMFTESSKPTIAKNASEVAVVTAMNQCLSLAVSNATTREKSTSPPPGERIQAHRDDEHQPGDLDDGQDDIELDALTDPAQVDQSQQKHEKHCDDDDPGGAPAD